MNWLVSTAISLAKNRTAVFAAKKLLRFSTQPGTQKTVAASSLALGTATLVFGVWDAPVQESGSLIDFGKELLGFKKEQFHAKGIVGDRVESGTVWGTAGKVANDWGQTIFSVATIGSLGKLKGAAKVGSLAAQQSAKTIGILKKVTLGLFGANILSTGDDVLRDDSEGLTEDLVDKGNGVTAGLTLAATYRALKIAGRAVNKLV